MPLWRPGEPTHCHALAMIPDGLSEANLRDDCGLLSSWDLTARKSLGSDFNYFLCVSDSDHPVQTDLSFKMPNEGKHFCVMYF